MAVTQGSVKPASVVSNMRLLERLCAAFRFAVGFGLLPVEVQVMGQDRFLVPPLVNRHAATNDEQNANQEKKPFHNHKSGIAQPVRQGGWR